MSDKTQSSSSLPKFRTLAADMEAARANQNPEPKEKPSKNLAATPKPKKNTPKKPIPIPKLKDLPKAPAKKAASKTIPKPPTKPTPKKIPAYHKLKKSVDAINATPAAKPIPKPKSKPTPPLIKKKAQKRQPKKDVSSTIITDTRSDGNDYFPQLIASISAWFKKVFTPKPKETPKYIVEDASRRKGVIKKATTKTGSIYTADNETLKEEIRKRRLAESKEETEHDPELYWSPYTDPGYDLIEAPDQEPKKALTPPQPTPEPTPRPEPIAPAPEPEPTPVAPAPSTPPIAPKPVPPPTPAPAPRPEPIAPAPEPEPTPVAPAPSVETPSATEAGDPPRAKPVELPDEEVTEDEARLDSEPTPPTESKDEDEGPLTALDTNTQTVIVMVVIVALLALILMGRVVYQYVMNTEETTQSVERLEVLVPDRTLVEIPLRVTEMNSALDQVRVTMREQNYNNLEIVFVTETGERARAAQVFDNLQLSMSPSMRQSIEQVRFVSINNSIAVLITFSNREEMLGGFLSWEEQMTRELGRLFDYTDLTGEFTDQQIEETDIRQLVSPNGNGIVYVINDTSAIITTNPTNLMILQNSINQP